MTRLLSKFYIEYDFEKLTYKVTYDIPAVIIALVVPALLYCIAIQKRDRTSGKKYHDSIWSGSCVILYSRWTDRA